VIQSKNRCRWISCELSEIDFISRDYQGMSFDDLIAQVRGEDFRFRRVTKHRMQIPLDNINIFCSRRSVKSLGTRRKQN